MADDWFVAPAATYLLVFGPRLYENHLGASRDVKMKKK